MNRMGMRLLDILFPNRCDCCKRHIRFDCLICAECKEALKTLECTPPDVWLLSQHPDETFLWDGFVSMYYYRGKAKAGVLSMKSGHKGFLNAMAQGLSERVKASFPNEHIDCITFVPVTRRRRRRQGFSHSEMLADALGRRLNIPVSRKLLIEQGDGIRQHQLSFQERQEYTERFFHTGKRLDGKTVLLCDDIVTTGTTLRQCTEQLKKCGAERVLVAVCACSEPKREKFSSPPT